MHVVLPGRWEGVQCAEGLGFGVPAQGVLAQGVQIVRTVLLEGFSMMGTDFQWFY